MFAPLYKGATGASHNPPPYYADLMPSAPPPLSVQLARRRTTLSNTETLVVTYEMPLPEETKFELKSPSFDISSPTHIGQSWKWLFQPKQVGTFLLSLEALTPKSDKVKWNWRIPRDVEDIIQTDSNGTLTLSIQVLTSLGLTAAQEAWLKAAGAVVGLLGTILGYPFWKRHFDGPVQRQQPIEPQDKSTHGRVKNSRKAEKGHRLQKGKRNA